MFELELMTQKNAAIFEDCTPGWKCNPDYCNPNFK